MARKIQWDLTWVFVGWMVVGSFLWLATPWMANWSAWLGPAWVWCLALPAGALALLMPRQTLALLAGAAGAAATAVVAGLAGGLGFAARACRTGGTKA